MEIPKIKPTTRFVELFAEEIMKKFFEPHGYYANVGDLDIGKIERAEFSKGGYYKNFLALMDDLFLRTIIRVAPIYKLRPSNLAIKIGLAKGLKGKNLDWAEKTAIKVIESDSEARFIASGYFSDLNPPPGSAKVQPFRRRS